MGRDRLRHHCASADAILEAIARRNQPIRPQTAQLNRLVDRYGAEAVERAIAEALQRGTPSSASVAHILDRQTQQAGAPPPLETILPDDPRVRDLRLRPYDLAPYDRLGDADEDES